MSGPFRTIEEKTGVPLMTWLPGKRDKTYGDNYTKINWRKVEKTDKPVKED
jgi:hypothetical protein